MAHTLDTSKHGFQWVIYRNDFVAYVTPKGFQLVAEVRARPDNDPYKRFAWQMANYALARLQGRLPWPYSDEDARMYARRRLLPREIQERPLANPSRTALELCVPISELMDRTTWFEPGAVGRGERPDPTVPQAALATTQPAVPAPPHRHGLLARLRGH